MNDTVEHVRVLENICEILGRTPDNAVNYDALTAAIAALAEIESLKAELNAWNEGYSPDAPARAAVESSRGEDYSYCLNLLAVIHRDGGHYTEAHGVKKSTDDAMTKWHEAAHDAEFGRPQPRVGRHTTDDLGAAVTEAMVEAALHAWFGYAGEPLCVSNYRVSNEENTQNLPVRMKAAITAALSQRSSVTTTTDSGRQAVMKLRRWLVCSLTHDQAHRWPVNRGAGHRCLVCGREWVMSD